MAFPGENLVIKLWETLIEKGFGSLLQPWQEKRLGVARLEIRRAELLMLEQIKSDIKEIENGSTKYSIKADFKKPLQVAHSENRSAKTEPFLVAEDVLQKVTTKHVAETLRNEVNASKAILIAEDVLSSEHSPTPIDTVDDDWLHSWREYAGRVSSSELQDLWGRILAGEIKDPGTYSFRTLEFLKSISKSEADLICKLAPFVVNGNLYRDFARFWEASGVTYANLLFLQGIGLLSGVEASGLTSTNFSTKADYYSCPFLAGQKVILVEHTSMQRPHPTNVYALTPIGTQILRLTNLQPNIEYLHAIGNQYAAQGFTVTIADWAQNEDGSRYMLNQTKHPFTTPA